MDSQKNNYIAHSFLSIHLIVYLSQSTTLFSESLVHAAKSGHCSEAEFLLSECHADPNVTDSEGKPLLTLNIQPQIIRQLLKHGAKADNVYKAHSKHIGKLSSECPLDNPLPIFITGDGGVGKSTLLKSMFSSSWWILKIFFGAKPVTDVDEKTVGIIPYEIVTKEFGRVIFTISLASQSFTLVTVLFLRMLFKPHAPLYSILLTFERVSKRLSTPLSGG